jgi:hypothetical protein
MARSSAKIRLQPLSGASIDFRRCIIRRTLDIIFRTIRHASGREGRSHMQVRSQQLRYQISSRTQPTHFKVMPQLGTVPYCASDECHAANYLKLLTKRFTLITIISLSCVLQDPSWRRGRAKGGRQLPNVIGPNIKVERSLVMSYHPVSLSVFRRILQ